MRRSRRLPSTLALALATLATAAPASAAEPAATVVGSLETVRPHDDPGGAVAAVISAASNEFESFQVVVAGGSTGLEDVEVSLAAPLAGPAGAIPASAVTIYREGYLRIRARSDLEGGTGRWPDPLIPAVDPFYGERRNAFPIDVPAGENRVAWIDVLVPAGQAAGSYGGLLEVRAAGGFAQLVPLQLEVRDFGLPSTATLESSFGMYPDVCEAHGSCGRDRVANLQLRALYVRAALEDRVTLSDAAYPAPTPGGEAQRFRRYILPLLQGGSPQDRDGLWSAVRLDGARLTSVSVGEVRYVDDWKREAARGGFADRVFIYACDEPSASKLKWRACKEVARGARARWRDLPVLITATIRTAVRFGADRLSDILVPQVNSLDNKPGYPYAGDQRRSYDEFLSRDGKRLWIYNSCSSHGCSGDHGGSDPYWRSWPSYVIDQPASEHRAMGFLAYEYGASGELYFDAGHDLKTAWSNQRSFGGNGDGTLFYPGTPERIGGTHDIPIESIRLKRIRDGHEDYEYLDLVDQAGRGAEAMAIARDLFPTIYSTDVPPATFEGAREQLADLLHPD